eukprot:COSAG02_NODE_2367_length_9051_cov_10.810433_8_plen_91_part_00
MQQNAAMGVRKSHKIQALERSLFDLFDSCLHKCIRGKRVAVPAHVPAPADIAHQWLDLESRREQGFVEDVSSLLADERVRLGLLNVIAAR